MPVHGRCRRHCRADQVGASALPLPAFKVAVGGGGATLARLQPVGVHRPAHGAARFAPLKTGIDEYLVQPFLLGLSLDQTGTRHHHRQLDVVGYFFALCNFCRLA